MSILRRTDRGDLYVEAGVETPVNLSKEQKKLAKKASEIVITFKDRVHQIFSKSNNKSDSKYPNRLIIRVQPNEGLRLLLKSKEPGPGGMRLFPSELNLSFEETFGARLPDAYERLLMDVVRGNLALFMRREEVEEAWEWVDGLLGAWADAKTPMHTYSAGLEDGPVESRMLLREDDRDWWSNGK